MTDIKWIKITTNIFDDEKIKCIEKMPEGDTILIIWIKLLVLAGRCNDCGMIYLTREIPYNEDMITTVIGRPYGIVKLAIDTFIKLGMIEVKENYIDIVKWEKYQNIDGMEKIRENTRKRVQEHRKRKQTIQCNVTETLLVTQGNASDIDIEQDIDKEKDIVHKNFIPPSISDVSDYLIERNIKSFTASYFIDYNQARGWMIGKNKMKDWKATVRTWEENNLKKRPKSSHIDLANTPIEP